MVRRPSGRSIVTWVLSAAVTVYSPSRSQYVSPTTNGGGRLSFPMVVQSVEEASVNGVHHRVGQPTCHRYFRSKLRPHEISSRIISASGRFHFYATAPHSAPRVLAEMRG